MHICRKIFLLVNIVMLHVGTIFHVNVMNLHVNIFDRKMTCKQEAEECYMYHSIVLKISYVCKSVVWWARMQNRILSALLSSNLTFVFLQMRAMHIVGVVNLQCKMHRLK